MTVAINKVGVIGSGQMGNGIAHVAALAGFDVVLNDVSADRLKSGMATINGNLSRQVAKKIITEDVRRCRYRCRYEEAGQGFARMAMLDAAAIDDPKRFRVARSGSLPGAGASRAINPAKLITPAASPNAATGGCEPCCTRPRTSC